MAVVQLYEWGSLSNVFTAEVGNWCQFHCVSRGSLAPARADSADLGSHPNCKALQVNV